MASGLIGSKVFIERTEFVAVVLRDHPAGHHITHFILSHNLKRRI